MLYIGNSFSLSMLEQKETFLLIEELSLEDIKQILEQRDFQFTSAIGHKTSAEVLSSLLGIEIPNNRIEIKLKKDDSLIVFQLLKRLEEGRILSSEELQNLPFKFFEVNIV